MPSLRVYDEVPSRLQWVESGSNRLRAETSAIEPQADILVSAC
jgi:hypothetical protein